MEHTQMERLLSTLDRVAGALESLSTNQQAFTALAEKQHKEAEARWLQWRKEDLPKEQERDQANLDWMEWNKQQRTFQVQLEKEIDNS